MKPLPLQIKLVKDILDSLNEAFPPKAIPSTMLVNGKHKNFIAQQDPYFTAYCTIRNVWWIVCSDYFVYMDNIDVLQEFADYIADDLGMTCHPCNQASVGIPQYKLFAKEKKGGITFFIGKVSIPIYKNKFG